MNEDLHGHQSVIQSTRDVPYSGAAWFDEGTGCGYHIGVAHWQDQTETTPSPAYYCN
jgi:hypothetical protein